MDYEREDKAALCRATWAIAMDEAEAAGASQAKTYGGMVPLRSLLDNGVTPWARDGWTFEVGDPRAYPDGRLGAIVERGGIARASFPVYRQTA